MGYRDVLVLKNQKYNNLGNEECKGVSGNLLVIEMFLY